MKIAVFNEDRGKKMGRNERHDAHAIKQILDRKTRAIVGWLYKWNNGDKSHYWKDEPKTDFIYQDPEDV